MNNIESLPNLFDITVLTALFNWKKWCNDIVTLRLSFTKSSSTESVSSFIFWLTPPKYRWKSWNWQDFIFNLILQNSTLILRSFSRKNIDIGFSGIDLLKESEINIQNKIKVIKKYEFGKANLVLAIPDLWIDVQTLLDLDEVADEFKKKKKKLLRVATKYPNLTREFLYSKGVTQFQLVKSLGSTEVAPFTGTAEIISDITSTGATLKANNLRELRDGEILKSQASMMVSKLSANKNGIKKLLKLLSNS